MKSEKYCSKSLVLGIVERYGKIFESLNILRGYIIIELLNIIVNCLRQFLFHEANAGNYLWIGSLISLGLLLTTFITIAIVRNQITCKVLMIGMATVIFVFHYEYKLLKGTSESEVYFEIMYMLPLMMSLGNEFSDKISYIFGSVIFAYIIVRGALASKYMRIPYSPHIQAGYTFYFIFMSFARMRKNSSNSVSAKMDRIIFESDEKIRKGIFEHIPAGIFTYDKISAQIKVENKEIISLLSDDPLITTDTQNGLLKFIKNNNITFQEQNTQLVYGSKMLNIYSENIQKSSINDVQLVIITDVTPFEQIAKSKFGMSFLTYITHELRSPLNVISSSFNMLSDVIPESAKHIYEGCKKGIHSLKYLIKDSLEFAKIEKGTYNLDYSEFDIRNFCDGIKNIFLFETKEKQLDFRFIIENNVPEKITQDKHKLKQILVIVIGNAIKYTSNGHIYIKVSYKHKSISFKVEDTGTGIKESDAEQIFKLYGQINDKLSRRETGIGFRLALCKDIVSILKGTLSAKRNEGIPGSTFSIVLPYTSDTESSAAGDNSELLKLGGRAESKLSRLLTINKSIRKSIIPKNSGSPHKNFHASSFVMNSLKSEHTENLVLIVDDNVSNIFVLKLMLSKMKIKFETATNGEEAVNKVMEKGMKNFTLILMDINMPVMNGIEASKKIVMASQQQVVPKIPIIAVSAMDDQTIIAEALAAGVKEFIEKPIAKDKLEMLIKKYEWEQN